MRVVLSAALVVALWGCGSRDGGDVVTVFAASSLTEAFGELAETFERSHPGVDVMLSTAGSQALRLQIEQGAAADVYASANPAHMAALVRGGFVGGDKVFAHNALVIAAPAANPAGLRTVEDLPRARRIVLGAPGVPVGVYTAAFLERVEARRPGFRASVMERTVSREPNVRLALAKVSMGEADAAVVYRTDVAARRGLTVVEIPEAFNVRADYMIGVLSKAPSSSWARRWVAFVGSEVGRAILVRHGFEVER